MNWSKQKRYLKNFLDDKSKKKISGHIYSSDSN